VANAKFVFIYHQSKLVTRAFKAQLAAVFDEYKLKLESCCLFLPRLNFDDFLSLNLASNVLLDTPGWSGGKTSLEGISCGLPVVTLPGEFMRGRHAYAMLKMMGINDTVAEDIDEYIDIAVRLGIDERFYWKNREKIRSRSDRLFEDYSVPAALAAFFKNTVKDLQTRSLEKRSN
jgi:predicted O-linked N-acetylglucosamine transferase (SPINDLY family)